MRALSPPAQKYLHLLPGKIHRPIRRRQRSQHPRRRRAALPRNGKHPLFQRRKEPPHAPRHQDPPQQGVLQTDVPFEVEAVFRIAPQPQAKHALERRPGDQLQPRGDQHGQQEIPQRTPRFSRLPKKLFLPRDTNDPVQQQEGYPINGAERHCGQGGAVPCAG